MHRSLVRARDQSLRPHPPANHEFYVKLTVDGVTMSPFSGEALEGTESMRCYG